MARQNKEAPRQGLTKGSASNIVFNSDVKHDAEYFIHTRSLQAPWHNCVRAAFVRPAFGMAGKTRCPRLFVPEHISKKRNFATHFVAPGVIGAGNRPLEKQEISFEMPSGPRYGFLTRLAVNGRYYRVPSPWVASMPTQRDGANYGE